MTPTFPDETVDGFPTPPREFADEDDRPIEVRRAGTEILEDLQEMYVDFNPDDRAQGIPPSEESAIRNWLETVVTEESLHVVASFGDALIGHAMLVPDEGDVYELAIFVLDEYQGARIGTELIRSLLGLAQSQGIERIWLTVERWNTPAIRLYEKVGFETTERQSFELEMSLRLA